MDVGPGDERDVRTALQEIMARLYDVPWEDLDDDLVANRIMPKIEEARLALLAVENLVQRVVGGETTWPGAGSVETDGGETS